MRILFLKNAHFWAANTLHPLFIDPLTPLSQKFLAWTSANGVGCPAAAGFPNRARYNELHDLPACLDLLVLIES